MSVATPVRPPAPAAKNDHGPRPRRRRGSLPGRLWRWLGSTTDLAPLCAFRVAFGLLLVLWYLQLAPDLHAFYSDDGMLPRSSLLALDGGRFSLLYTAAYDWQVWAFWLASIVVAAAVLVGYRTRLACALAFVSLISFEARNPLVLDGSDVVFRVLACWLIFAPSGARYSVDSLLRRRSGSAPQSTGAALPLMILRLQVAWIFLATALEKLAGPSWLNGTAMYYVLQLSHTFARPWVAPLASVSPLVHAATWGALSIELWFFPVVFLGIFGRTARLAIVLGAALMFAGIFATMNVGNFPLVMEACLLLFVPASFADRLAALVEKALGFATRLVPPNTRVLHRGCGATPQRAALLDDSEASIAARRGKTVLVGAGRVGLVVIAACAMWTALPGWLASLRPPPAIDQVAAYVGLKQRWDMFAPDPTRTDGWLVGPGWLEDGTHVDVVNGGLYAAAPRFASPLYSRWAKVEERIVSPDYDAYRMDYARMFCHQNDDHLAAGHARLETFELVFVERDIPPPGRGVPVPEEHKFWTHAC